MTQPDARRLGPGQEAQSQKIAATTPFAILASVDTVSASLFRRVLIERVVA